MTILRIATRAAVGLAISLLIAAEAQSQATTYVPILDPSYLDLDALIDAGWVRSAVVASRPYSRLTMAKYIASARRHVDSSAGVRPARYLESLERLDRAFRAELGAMCAEGVKGCQHLPSSIRLRWVGADGSGTNSKGRPVRASFTDQPTSNIQATLNPLLQNNQGRELVDGVTLGVEGLVDATVGKYLALQVHPRTWANRERGFSVGGGATLQEGYARAVAGNWSLEAGRNHPRHGYGESGGPLLSDNPRGVDLVRLSMEHPAVAPSVFRVFGPMTASALFAELGGNSRNPHSKLVVFNGDIQPWEVLELGATVLNHFGGSGSPRVSWRERLGDVLFIFPQGGVESDKAFGVNARLRIPRLRASLYADMMTTDAQLPVVSAQVAFVDNATWIGGGRLSGLGPGARGDVWFEARRSGVIPYTHHQLTSGLTLDNRILGDAMGPLSASGTMGVDWQERSSRVSLRGTVARSIGDRYHTETTPETALYVWIRERSRPDEVRWRGTAEWSNDVGAPRLAKSARLALERVKHWDFGATSRSNFLAQLRLDYRP